MQRRTLTIRFDRVLDRSLPGGALPPYRGRSFTGRTASASPDALELNVRIHSAAAESQPVVQLSKPPARARRGGRRTPHRRIVECLNLTLGIGTGYGSCVHEFRTAKLRRGSRTFVHD